MRTTIPLAVELPTPTLHIQLAPETPLMCDGDEAAKLFGISVRTLAALRQHHRDFPVRKIGGAVRYLVPDLYAWFRDYGGDIPTE